VDATAPASAAALGLGLSARACPENAIGEIPNTNARVKKIEINGFAKLLVGLESQYVFFTACYLPSKSFTYKKTTD
jgi:hypothetical protein